MNKDQRRELEAIQDAAASRRRPVLDYSRMSAEEFVVIWHNMRCMVEFSVILVEMRSRRNGGKMSSQESDEMSTAPLTKEKILKLADWYYDPRLFSILADYMGEEPFLIKEVATRLKDREIAKNLVIIPSTTGREGNRDRVLKVFTKDKRDKNLFKVLPMREREYNSDDLEQKALSKAWETIQKESNIRSVPLRPYPLQLGPEIQDIWDRSLGEMWRRGMEDKIVVEGKELRFGMIAAGLRLEDEVVHQKVRDHLRNLWQTIGRHETFLAGSEDFPEAGTESWRADWDFSKTAMRNRAQKIESETSSLILNPEEWLQQKEAQREALKETLKLTTGAYEIAAKRSGKKGIVFLHGLKAGKTEIEAAREAKISDRTGRRILQSIRKSHPRKSPQITGR